MKTKKNIWQPCWLISEFDILPTLPDAMNRVSTLLPILSDAMNRVSTLLPILPPGFLTGEKSRVRITTQIRRLINSKLFLKF
ncbi:MAG: hypothetical protein C6Y22_17745 [Hapalosiphonaceae cyanobacterium JJU2]|nr:MAG: hypothetical protein C6Y22_17745 [Hapalosiphonaceae cyanobacterium JJU2]